MADIPRRKLAAARAQGRLERHTRRAGRMLERGEIERMMYYAKPEETDVTGDVEAFLTKNDADGNKVVNTSELEIAVQTRDRLECELRDGIRARHTASRSEEERVARGCEKAKMKSELRPLNFCGASATATVKARRYAPFALRALAAVASSRSFCPFAEWRSFREWGCAPREVGGSGRFCSSGRGRLDGVVRARELAGQNPRSRGHAGGAVLGRAASARRATLTAGG